MKTIVVTVFITWMTVLNLPFNQQNPADVADDGPLLKDISAESIDEVINRYKGEKAVLVNIWATWCGPCVEEFPYIVKLQKQYPEQLQVIFVSADFSGSRDRVKKFLNEHGVDWTTYFKTGKDEKFINTLEPEWSGALPFTKIYNKNGKVTDYWESSADFDKFERSIKQALK